MPINTAGVYTPPDGAENAVPGEVIRSATWNTIFTDLSTALTQLAEGVFLPTPRTISTAGSFTVLATDTTILVKVPASTITLPLSATKLGVVKIFGAAGTIFGSNNSVLVGTSAETINGALTRTLTTNYQSILLYPTVGGYLVG